MISEYSFIMGLLWFNLFLFIVFLLRKRVGNLGFCAYLLIATTLVGAVRVVFPFDFPFTKVIKSYGVFPSVQVALNAEVLGSSISLLNLLLGIWLVGIFVALIAAMADVWRSYNYTKTISIIPNFQAEQVMQHILLENTKLKACKIVTSPQVETPQIIGIFSPKLFIPYSELSDEELRCIITHELMHKHHHHIWIKWFYYLLCIVFWWNPLVHLVRRDLDSLLEISCDMRVTKKMTLEERVGYLSTMLIIIRKFCLSKENSPINALAFANGHDEIGIIQRFEAVANAKKTPVWKVALPSTLLVVTFALSFLVFIQPASNPPIEDLEGEIIITPENSYIQIDNSGTYYFVYNGSVFGEVTKSELGKEPYSKLDIIKGEG